MIKTLFYVASVFCLFGCGDSRERIPADAPGYVNGKAVHPTIKIGRPYRVAGNKYYPEYDDTYDETGEASWYGPNFHGKTTANGERFNQWAMTAAHPTLPMPSMVRVTELESGKSIVVRINDRGPFAHDRIIDLSRAAAEELGVRAKGVAQVRVQYLKPETEEYIARLQLKKPDEWREKETQLAKAAHESVLPRDQLVSEEVLRTELLPPAEVVKASELPRDFAYNQPSPSETTVSVRGVEMEEIGYAEDAFSVLDKEDYMSDYAAYEPAPAIETASKPSPKAPAGEQIFVQAGSFTQQGNATRLAQSLRAFSSVNIEQHTGPAGSLWRVLVGPLFNWDAAREVKQRLVDYNIRDALIIRE